MDCFFVGRLKGRSGTIWQLTTIDIASSFAWAELVVCPNDNPTATQTSKLAKRGRTRPQVRRASSPTTATVPQRRVWPDARASPGPPRPHPRRRPQTNGNAEALHKTIFDECWRPAFARYLYPRYAGQRRELNAYLRYYNHDRVHHGCLTCGQIPADPVYGARKMETR